MLKLLNLQPHTPLQVKPIGDLYIKLSFSELENDRILSCKLRADCAQMESELQALQSQRKSVSASALPAVNLSLEDRRSDGLLFVAESDQRAILEFSWALFSGGQRRSQKKSLIASESALEQRLIALHQQIQIDISRAKARHSSALSSLELANSSLALSEERLRLSRKRYENNLLNLDQLLDAEASLSTSIADVANAKIELVGAWVQMQLALGEGFEALLD